MFESYFKKRNAIKAAREEEWEEQEQHNLDLAQNELMKETHIMISKPCAVNDGKNCSRECVHFKAGTTYLGDFIGSYRPYGACWTKPKCKLWK